MSAYTVRKPGLGALSPLLGIAVIVILTRVVDLPGFPVVFLAAFALFTVYAAWRGSILLKVDADGVLLGRGVENAYGRRQRAGAAVPWPSIREVVVFGGEEVGLRLRDGAPMPDGVRAVIHDPRNPDAVPPGLRAAVPRLDRLRLQQAVAEFGGGARVVDGSA